MTSSPCRVVFAHYEGPWGKLVGMYHFAFVCSHLSKHVFGTFASLKQPIFTRTLMYSGEKTFKSTFWARTQLVWWKYAMEKTIQKETTCAPRTQQPPLLINAQENKKTKFSCSSIAALYNTLRLTVSSSGQWSQLHPYTHGNEWMSTSNHVIYLHPWNSCKRFMENRREQSAPILRHYIRCKYKVNI